MSVPYGYCHCGCGQKTRIAEKTRKRTGAIKGQPLRYLPHHYRGGKPPVHYGPDNPRWNNGRTVSKQGYVFVHRPDDPDANPSTGYISEHRLIARQLVGGRRLERHEEVHHINGVTDDNRLENLEVLVHAEHALRHRKANFERRLPGEPNPLIECACGCGELRPKYDRHGLPKRFIHNHHWRVEKAAA